jgi:hypothetical protein
VSGGSFLASQAEEQLCSSEIEREQLEIERVPVREAAELAFM